MPLDFSAFGKKSGPLQATPTKSKTKLNFGSFRPVLEQQKKKKLTPVEQQRADALSKFGVKEPEGTPLKMSQPPTMGGKKLGFEFTWNTTDASKALARDISTEQKNAMRGGTFDDTKMEIDHIVPVSLGGTRADYNLQALESLSTKQASRQDGKLLVELDNIDKYKKGLLTQGQAIYNILQYQWSNEAKKSEIEKSAQKPNVLATAVLNSLDQMKEKAKQVAPYVLAPLDFIHRTGLQVTAGLSAPYQGLVGSLAKLTGNEDLKDVSYDDIWKQSFEDAGDLQVNIGAPTEAFKVFAGKEPKAVEIPQLKKLEQEYVQEMIEAEKNDDWSKFLSGFGKASFIKFSEDWSNPFYLFSIKGVSSGSFKMTPRERIINTIELNPAKDRFLQGKGGSIKEETKIYKINVEDSDVVGEITKSGKFKNLERPDVKMYVQTFKDGKVKVTFTNSGGDIISKDLAKKITQDPSVLSQLDKTGSFGLLQEGQLKPQYIESFKKNATMQILDTTAKEVGEANARMYSRLINEADLSGAKTADQLEDLVFRALGGKDNVPKTVVNAVKNWTNSVEQIRFYTDVLDKAKPAVTEVLKQTEKVAAKTVAKTAEEYVASKGAKLRRVSPEMNLQANLTTKVLKKLEGRKNVSRQFISDLTNSPDLKQTEKDLIRRVLSTLDGDSIDVAKFTSLVQRELLPLKVDTQSSRYEGVTLQPSERGEVKDYFEKVYESPIETEAGKKHFVSDNYFGHTRIEDLANPVAGSAKNLRIVKTNKTRPYNLIGDGVDQNFATLDEAKNAMNLFEQTIEEGEKIRRVIEVQSDLYQKGVIERELPADTKSITSLGRQRLSEANRLLQYNNPTAHFRLIREEIQKAAEDSVSKLQFPTGETAMKIEGLGDVNSFANVDTQKQLEISDLKVGLVVESPTGKWVITEKHDSGRFTAMPLDSKPPKISLEEFLSYRTQPDRVGVFDALEETFDISSKGYNDNPIYKFYEKEVGRYLRSNYNAKLVRDSKGVTWWEVSVKPEMKGSIEAFRLKEDLAKKGIKVSDEQEAEIIKLNKEIFGDDDVKILGQILTNKEALGRYEKGIIEILNGQADPKGTFYHEAVHKYLDVFTDRSEQIELLKEGQKLYKIDDFEEIEERLAEDFIKYAKTREGITGRLKVLFDKIINRIKAYFKNKSKIDELYAKILEKKKAKEVVSTYVKREIASEKPVQFYKGEIRESRSFKRLMSKVKTENPDLPEYEVMNLVEDRVRAEQFIKDNPAIALRIAKGLELPPEGITQNAISAAMIDKAIREGDSELVDSLSRKLSFRATRMGQEIATLRQVYGENDPQYYINQILQQRIAKNFKVEYQEGKPVAYKKLQKQASVVRKIVDQRASSIQSAQDLLNSLIC